MITAAKAPDLRRSSLEYYLESVLGGSVRILEIMPIGASDASKGYGYGTPLRIDYELDGCRRRSVLETVRPGPFGHEHRADRAQGLLWSHAAFNDLPHHVRSLDVGAVRPRGHLVSLGDAEEFFILTDFVEGEPYATDLSRLAADPVTRALDRDRADALCDYLVEIHQRRGPDPGLYVRRIRELVGHGECIMGLTDSYPAAVEGMAPGALEAIEHRAVEWRWRLKGRAHRLRQVHGDFHPWNLLFRDGTDFTAIDRSRGEWGEPADDVVCLTLNYVFFSLRRGGRFEGAFRELFERFWDRYLERSADREILEVAAPFAAFRGLVMASPVWYPSLDPSVRRSLFTLLRRVLDAPGFEPWRVAEYLED